MKSAKLFLILLTAVLFAGCHTYEYDYYGGVKGTVIDSQTNAPISDAYVLLMPGSQSTNSTIEGTFEFQELEEGQYTISVQKTGFQYNSVTINIISGENISTTIRLMQLK